MTNDKDFHNENCEFIYYNMFCMKEYRPYWYIYTVHHTVPWNKVVIVNMARDLR